MLDEGKSVNIESFATVAEHAPAMLWRGDAAGRCVYLNRAQREFWGVEADKISEFIWANTLLPEDAEKVFGPFSAGMANRAAFQCEGRYRRADGALRILRTQAEPFFDAAGGFQGMVGVNTDVTEERRAFDDLLAAEERRRLLMKEMSHRIKNNLSTVLSIAAQTGRSANSYEEFHASFQARLQALAKSHDLLMRDATDKADLREILEAELEPYRSGEGAGRGLTLEGGPAPLSGRAAIGMAMVVHELATNAAKYGAYSRGGTIDVRWDAADGAVHFIWRERGGPRVTPPQRSGFGSRLIEGIVRGELGGSVATRFDPEGFEAELIFRTSIDGP